jgi:hypothetical protein
LPSATGEALGKEGLALGKELFFLYSNTAGNEKKLFAECQLVRHSTNLFFFF